MALLASPIPGQVLAVFFEDDVYWHERLLLWRHDDDSWYILTPDLDVYAENLSGSGADGPSKVKTKGVDFRYWSRVGGSSYRFANPISDDQMLRSYIKQAYRAGLKEDDFDADWRPEHVVDAKGVVQPFSQFLGDRLVSHRLVGKGPASRLGGGVVTQCEPSTSQQTDIATVRPISAPGPDQTWVVVENLEGFKVGDSAVYDVSRDLMIGDHTGLIKVSSGWLKAELMEVAKATALLESRRPVQEPPAPLIEPTVETVLEEASADARTLLVDFDHQGIRFKEWRALVTEVKDYAYSDWPFEGPDTVLYLLKHMYKYGGDPKQWLELWCRQKGIADQDRVKHELRCLMDVLYLGGTYDQLNLPVLASFETVARRIQCIVDAYALGSSAAPDWGNAKLFTGYMGPDDLVMPQLKTWAARKGKEEVELHQARNRMKELRKPANVSEEAANALAEGGLPAGVKARPKRGARGKGLEAPASST